MEAMDAMKEKLRHNKKNTLGIRGIERRSKKWLVLSNRESVAFLLSTLLTSLVSQESDNIDFFINIL